MGATGEETRPLKIGRKRRHVHIPEGWRRVWSGPCVEGDRFLDASKAEFEGLTSWISTDADDHGEPADFFLCLIRKMDDHANVPTIR